MKIIFLALTLMLASCRMGDVKVEEPLAPENGLTVSLGAFSILGIQSDGGLDSTVDANLNFENSPRIIFGASTGASSYSVTVLNADTSVKCATTVAVLTTFDFSSCDLTLGENYFVTVTAVNGSTTLAATNSPFSFRYNQAPLVNADTLTLMYDGAAVVVDPRANDTDADGDTLTITATSVAGFGTTSFTGTTSTYTPDATNFGTTSFTYTVSDGRGATATGTVNVRAFTKFTWTGNGVPASGLRNWSDQANWCGSIASPGLSGACSGTGGVPNNLIDVGHRAIFNSLCTNCNATIGAAAQANLIELKTGYTGTLTQAAGAGNTLTAGGINIEAGTFTGGSANITFARTNSAPFIQTGGTFTSTSGILSLTQDGATASLIANKTGGTFTPNAAGWIYFIGSSAGSPTYSITGLGATSAAAGANWKVKILSTSGAGESDKLTVSFPYFVDQFEIGRSSGSGTVALGTGTITVLTSSLATNGARSGAGTVEFIDNATYGSSGDGVHPAIHTTSLVAGSYSVTPSTANASIGGLFIEKDTVFNAPSPGLLSIVKLGTGHAQDGDLRLDMNSGFLANFGTVKFVAHANLLTSTNHVIDIRSAGQDINFYRLTFDSSGATNTVNAQFNIIGTTPFVSVTSTFTFFQAPGGRVLQGFTAGAYSINCGTLVMDGTTSTAAPIGQGEVYTETSVTSLNGAVFPGSKLSLSNPFMSSGFDTLTLTGHLLLTRPGSSLSATSQPFTILDINGTNTNVTVSNGVGTDNVLYTTSGVNFNLGTGALTYEGYVLYY